MNPIAPLQCAIDISNDFLVCKRHSNRFGPFNARQLYSYLFLNKVCATSKTATRKNLLTLLDKKAKQNRRKKHQLNDFSFSIYYYCYYNMILYIVFMCIYYNFSFSVCTVRRIAIVIIVLFVCLSFLL